MENKLENINDLKITDMIEGQGEAVKNGDHISIHYQGKFTDGREFDSSYKRGTPFQCYIGRGQVIPGWDKGIIGLKVGGKRRLEVPYRMAYGEHGAPPHIPPRSDMIFDVELIKIG